LLKSLPSATFSISLLRMKYRKETDTFDGLSLTLGIENYEL
jgi:hypothetical protein